MSAKLLGLAKTKLVETMARFIPFDILGSEVLDEVVVAKAAIGSVIFGQEGVVVQALITVPLRRHPS